jgi:hypothetical protein
VCSVRNIFFVFTQSQSSFSVLFFNNSINESWFLETTKKRLDLI